MTARKQSTKSRAEELLRADLAAAGFSPIVGYEFHPSRRWAFDLCFGPPARLAIEIDGKGRHGTDKGMREDQQKINAAVEMGWRVLRYPARSVTTATRRALVVEQIRRVLCGVS